MARKYTSGKFHEILERTPLETKLRVSTELAFISLITDLGFREEKGWDENNEADNALLKKLMHYANLQSTWLMKEIKDHIELHGGIDVNVKEKICGLIIFNPNDKVQIVLDCEKAQQVGETVSCIPCADQKLALMILLKHAGSDGFHSDGRMFGKLYPITGLKMVNIITEENGDSVANIKMESIW